MKYSDVILSQYSKLSSEKKKALVGLFNCIVGTSKGSLKYVEISGIDMGSVANSLIGEDEQGYVACLVDAISLSGSEEIALVCNDMSVTVGQMLKIQTEKVSFEDMMNTWVLSEDDKDDEESPYNEEDAIEDVSVEEAEEEAEYNEDDEMLIEEYVDPLVTDILGIYENIIAPCFEKQVYGVLTNQGVITLSNNGELRVRRSKYMQRLYNCINSLTKKTILEDSAKEIVESSMISSDCALFTNYVPKFQAMLVYGLKDGKRENNWGIYKYSITPMLKEKVLEICKSIPEERLIDMKNAIRMLFTNVIIVDKFDIKKELRIRYKLEDIENSDKIGACIKKYESSIFGVGEGKTELVSDVVGTMGIHSILYVFDKNLFAGDVLFAYRAFEDKIRAGGSINEMSVLLGQKLNGNDEVINMGSPQNVSTVLMAGSGSGKGVLTLNILATLVTRGCPFAYLDFKPDMAGALWDLERETGAKILAIDSLGGRTSRGSEPIRKYEFGKNALTGVGLDTSKFAIIPYLKLMQLSTLLASYRANGLMPVGKKVFFILDEAQGCNAVYAKMMSTLTTYVNKNKKATDSEELDYATHMLNAYGPQLTDDIGNVINTTGRQGLIGYFTIGQDCDPDNWKDGVNTTWSKSLFGVMVGKCHTKFIGKNGGKSPTYSAVGMKDGGGLSYVTGKGDEEGKLGYFVTAHGSNCKDAIASVFKSYLVLNDADYEKDPENGFAASLLKNIQDPILRDKIINEDFYNDGKLNERVGFKGLMKYIAQVSGVDINKSLSSGYEVVWQAMKMCGLANKYSCIEEYLFDCGPDSIFTLSELKDGVYSSYSANKNANSEGNVVFDLNNESVTPTTEPENDFMRATSTGGSEEYFDDEKSWLNNGMSSDITESPTSMSDKDMLIAELMRQIEELKSGKIPDDSPYFEVDENTGKANYGYTNSGKSSQFSDEEFKSCDFESDSEEVLSQSL